jgi:hypothetical protein
MDIQEFKLIISEIEAFLSKKAIYTGEDIYDYTASIYFRYYVTDPEYMQIRTLINNRVTFTTYAKGNKITFIFRIPTTSI